MINFSTITACGECCDGCKKSLTEYVRAVLKQTDMFPNGNSLEDVKCMLAPENTMFNSVDYVQNFRVLN